MEIQNLNKVITSYLVYAAPVLFVLTYSILLASKRLIKPLLICTIVFSFGSVLEMGFLGLEHMVIFIFVFFFFIPYTLLSLDAVSIIYEKDWTKALKIISLIHIVLVGVVIIMFNLLRTSGHHPLGFLPERIMILSVGVLFFFACKYQQKQEIIKSAIFKILAGLTILACWIYFSKVTFSKESFLFNFSL